MCGIFGVILGKDSGFTHNKTKLIIDHLFKLSESRGKEASGVALSTSDAIYVAKHAVPASEMIRRKDYKDIYKVAFGENSTSSNGQASHPICIIGHSRLVTNGGQQVHSNNQPAISSGMTAIHNGIITNAEVLWERFTSIERSTDLDTEILLSLIRKFFQEKGSLVSGVQETFNLIEGVASIAVFFEDLNSFLLATNNGSLYLGTNNASNAYIFASENYIMQTLIGQERLRGLLRDFKVEHVKPGTGYLLNLDNLHLDRFSLAPDGHNGHYVIEHLDLVRKIIDISPKEEINTRPAKIPGEGPYVLAPSFIDEYPQRKIAIANLRRCTRCVLPETMPFIKFDEQGVCNYCRNYKPIETKGIEALQEILEPYRNNNDDKPDCLAAFSGGRDSSYTVHILKNVLEMTPITYTYDWGMVTDLARRNQMRICGKLGLEHILVSADINKKRNNIKKNVLAWLKCPDLGTIPLFMAGDKQYFYYANKVARQTGVEINIFGDNMLETTLFKTGFCGIAPHHSDSHAYSIPFVNQMRLAWYYGSRAMANPAYLNSSVTDTVGAYLSYFFIPHNYVNIYEYVRWDEDVINSTLISEYNWETDPGTTTNWRIGDGTAAFYNFIYYTMAGITENDTFRSNQIREGVLTREKAMCLVEKENEPRYESMQWYCDIIGIDFYETIKIINAAPKLYP